MPVPKKKTSKSRRNMRRSHLALDPVYFSQCPNCHSLKTSHAVCSVCGFYKGRMLPISIVKSGIRFTV